MGGAKRVIGHQKISFAKWKGLGLGLGLEKWILNSKLDEHEKFVWENLKEHEKVDERGLFGKIEKFGKLKDHQKGLNFDERSLLGKLKSWIGKIEPSSEIDELMIREFPSEN